MKTKRINKKMSLKKVTVTRLNGIEQNNVLGGVYTRETHEQQCTAEPYCPPDYTVSCDGCLPHNSDLCTVVLHCTFQNGCSYMQ